ncbi:phage holin family protein [uncultured Pseudomonas sp.]|uniref:phage holin family protein n=1 Tax=uncultured Pseudomonas sp. TaxID=114707 RepID=UPI0025D8B1A2|nr:phage holin family protein [uncultured Pseudomonas sp.]
MLDKDPGLLASTLAFVQAGIVQLAASGTAQGILAAAVISALRALYDGERRWVRVLIESLLCGALTGPASTLTAFGILWFKPDWTGTADSVATMVGGAIGFAGVMQLRKIIVKRLGLEATDA